MLVYRAFTGFRRAKLLRCSNGSSLFHPGACRRQVLRALARPARAPAAGAAPATVSAIRALLARSGSRHRRARAGSAGALRPAAPRWCICATRARRCPRGDRRGWAGSTSTRSRPTRSSSTRSGAHLACVAGRRAPRTGLTRTLRELGLGARGRSRGPSPSRPRRVGSSGMEAATAHARSSSRSTPPPASGSGAVPITAPDDVAGGRRRGRPGPAVLGAADARRPRPLPGAGRAGADRRVRRDPRPDRRASRASRATRRSRWRCCRRSTRCTGSAAPGMEILADEKIPMPQLFLKTKRSAFTYEPLGVIGVISPWNYPWSIPFGEVALALMAGNGVVLKPASLTPLIGERIAQGVRARRRARGPRARRPRPGHRLRAREVRRGQGVLHRLGRDRPRRR